MPVGIFAGRNYLQIKITRSVQFRFDEKLEKIRAELRESEERLKSNLRVKETEISALRDGALSGRTQRQVLVDKRRLEAVEKVWRCATVTSLPYHTVAGFMAHLEISEVQKRLKTGSKLNGFFDQITKNIPDDQLNLNDIMSEQIFISPIAWAYFSAYRIVLMTSYGQGKTFFSWDGRYATAVGL